MTNRAFSGGVLVGLSDLSAGWLEVKPLPRHGTTGGTILSAQAFVYVIAEGDLPVDAQIPSPMYARFRVYADGDRRPILEFTGSVAESAEPITLGEIYRATGPEPDVDPEIMRTGDRVTRLIGDGTAGQVPVQQADGTLAMGDMTGGGGSGDVVGPASATDAQVAVFSGTTGKLIADGGATVAGVRDRATHTGEQAISTVTGLQTALDAKVAKAGDTMTGPLILSGAPTLDLHAATKAYVDAGSAGVVIPAVMAGSMATVQDDATRTANTAAINAAIVTAQADGKAVVFTSFCWCDAGITTNGAACDIRGLGPHTGIGMIDESGILLDMRVTSGYAQAPTNLTIFGPNEYIPTNEYDGGVIPTTYTCVGLAVGRATGGTAQHLRLERVHVLGFYDGVTMTNCTMALVTGNILQHGRRSCLYIQHTYDSDSGDTSITDNWFHVANSGSPGYAAGTTVAMQVDGTSGLYVHSNKVYMRSDVGFNVNLANATYDIATSPAIKHIFTSNWFDSGGLVAGSNCIKIRSAWGSGGTGTAVTGNRISGVVVSNNVGHNCANLLDLSSFSGGITNIDIADNVMFGGGGITLAGVIDRIRITGNTFDDGGWTGSYGPAKPVTSTATITNGRYYGNEWIGFSSAPDLADESGGGTTVDTSPATTELTDGATITVTCDTTRVRQKHRVVLGGNRTITWDVTGDDATLEGMEGDLWVVQDATGSRTVTWTAPSGIEAIRWVGNSAPTLTTTANAYDLIRWEVVATENGNYLMLTPHLNFGTVTPPVVGGFTLTTLSTNTWLYAFDPGVGVYDADTGGNDVTGTNDASIGRLVDTVDGSVAAAQATAGSRPVLKTNVLNGKSVAQFNADYLSFAIEAAQSRAYTLIVVMKTTATDSNLAMRYVADATSTDFRLRLRPDTTGTIGTVHRFQFGDEIANGYIFPSVDYANDTWRIVTGVAAASGDLRVDEASIGTGNAGNNLAGTETVYIGADNAGANGLIGQIAFIGLMAGSDATDIAAVEADLATHFGL